MNSPTDPSPVSYPHSLKHVAAIYAKLGATSRTEALRLGIERGLLSL